MGNKELYIENQLNKAIKYGQFRNYTQAIKILEPLAVEFTIKCPKIMLYLGRAYHAIKDFSLAISAFHTYLAINSHDASAWFFLGRSYLAMDLYKKACSAFSKSLQIKPNSCQTLALSAFTLLKLKDSQKALKTFEAALTLEPDNEKLNNGYKNALFIEAVKTYQKNNPNLAMRMFEFLINNDFDSVIVYLYYGHCLEAQNYLVEALQAYKNAINLSPEDESLKWYEIQILLKINQNSILQKIESLQTKNNNPYSLLDLEIDIIYQTLDKQNWQGVINLGRQYIKKYVDSQNIGYIDEVHYAMGIACKKLKKLSAAINHFLLAQKINSQNLLCRQELLSTYLDLQDFESIQKELNKKDAKFAKLNKDTILYYQVICDCHFNPKDKNLIKKLQEVLQLFENDQLIMTLLANQYFIQNNYNQAEKIYGKLLKINKYNEDVNLNLITCYEKQKKYNKAKNAYKDYLKKWTKNHKIRLNFIKLLVENSDYSLAADQIEKLLPYAQNPDAVIRDLAFYRKKAGEYNVAAIHFRALIQKDPKNSSYIYNLVFCLIKQNKELQALQIIKKFHQLKKPNVDGYLIQAQLLYKLDKTEESLDLLREALKKYSKEKSIKEKIRDIYLDLGNTDMANMFN